MRSTFLVIFLLVLGIRIYPQPNMNQVAGLRSDSVIQLLKTEKDDRKKISIILRLYQTSIDGYPLIILQFGQQLLEISRSQNDIILESAGWSTMGQGYRLTGNYVKGLECHRKAVALAEKSGNLTMQAFTLNQMGHIYKDRLENEQALSLYRTALNNVLLAKTDHEMWFPYMNISAVYYNAGNLDSALYYGTIAETISTRVNGVANMSIVYGTIGGVYGRKGDLVKARNYFEKAIRYATDLQSPRYISTSYVAFAEFFTYNQQFDSAAFYCKKAIDIVKGTELSHFVLKPARMLIDYYQNIQADSTVKYWKVYSAANDSLNNTRTNQQIQTLTFEEEQRKRDIQSEREKYQNKVRTGFLLGGLLLFCVAAIILLRNNRQKHKANNRLQQTLSELQNTQKQLVQSEKMASLGELTAGIAHEIQNPLNFVNNFSEVSRELLEEMRAALDKGEKEEAREIAGDVMQNMEKILHHGKRADGIVKGMLQHSRSSNGQKEPTDINALCDEYLRLAYHGWRARDSTFNARFETRLDPQAGQVRIIPQDIGRVILNLISNAFFAVDEKKKKLAGFEPLVLVSTEREKEKMLIRIKDNGNGIPKPVLEKIFQPFFTTKPTGQGTGLGLSLSYDIVKAHGGEIRVDTVEGEGTEFIIELPLTK